MIVPFGDFLPDVPVLGNPGSTTANNVMPSVAGYLQLNGISPYSTALLKYCRGSFSAVAADGNSYSYAGDETNLYRLVGRTQTNSSSSPGVYACAADSYWRFTKFKDRVIATNFDDNIQVIALSGSAFANLAGSPPKARHIDTVRDFVMVGNTFDGVDGNVPIRVRWCALGNEESWAVSATTQADFQDLQGNGGAVQSIIGGERAVVFQERAVWLGTYVGSPVVFQFDKIESERGALCPRGQVLVGGVVYYIANDGFYAISGGQSVPIGFGKVDRWFIDSLNHEYLHRVTAAAIPDEKVIIWSYPDASSSDGTPNRLILYNWASQKWATADLTAELIAASLSVGTTLEGLDAVSASIDSLEISLDSRAWMGGAQNLSAFDTSHKLNYFNGTALEATIETGEFQPAGMEGRRSEITELTSIVDGGTHTAQMGSRETQQASISWGALAAENDSGITEVRSNARYHRVRQIITGGFRSASGVLVKARPTGER